MKLLPTQPSLKSVLIEEVEPERKPLIEMTDAELIARIQETRARILGKTYEETGHIHKDDLEAHGYVHKSMMNESQGNAVERMIALYHRLERSVRQEVCPK